jgi:hypothetical protein
MSRDLPATDEATMTAFVVRRFQVLARPSIGNLTVDDLNEGDRWTAVVQALRDDNADPFDLLSLNGVEPIDLACAQAVRKLSRSRRGAGDALDVLAVLDRRRKAALFYALPEAARDPLERHASFGPVIAPYRDTLDAALFDLDELFASMLDGFRSAAESGEPERIARFLPPRFRSLIPDDLRLQEVRR